MLLLNIDTNLSCLPIYMHTIYMYTHQDTKMLTRPVTVSIQALAACLIAKCTMFIYTYIHTCIHIHIHIHIYTSGHEDAHTAPDGIDTSLSSLPDCEVYYERLSDGYARAQMHAFLQGDVIMQGYLHVAGPYGACIYVCMYAGILFCV